MLSFLFPTKRSSCLREILLLSWTKLSEDREKELNFGDRQSLWAQFKFPMEIGLGKAE